MPRGKETQSSRSRVGKQPFGHFLFLSPRAGLLRGWAPDPGAIPNPTTRSPLQSVVVSSGSVVCRTSAVRLLGIGADTQALREHGPRGSRGSSCFVRGVCGDTNRWFLAKVRALNFHCGCLGPTTGPAGRPTIQRPSASLGLDSGSLDVDGPGWPADVGSAGTDIGAFDQMGLVPGKSLRSDSACNGSECVRNEPGSTEPNQPTSSGPELSSRFPADVACDFAESATSVSRETSPGLYCFASNCQLRQDGRMTNRT
jgi:hypothetical protein